ncbi:MAG TPA: transglycosylase SLT domain-containing protein [Saccharofermentans sp.]|nr:transglycosylase SLT domain-containing protein [Saccharofermentans sp.]
MKTTTIAIISLLATHYVHSNVFIEALIDVESKGNPKAIGDGGKAFGALQIHKICIDDVNRVYGTSFVHEDAFDVEKAKEICRLYLSHYGKHYERTEKKTLTYEVLARIWNGGPKGYKKEATTSYWFKVVDAMNRHRKQVAKK